MFTLHMLREGWDTSGVDKMMDLVAICETWGLCQNELSIKRDSFHGHEDTAHSPTTL